MALAGTYRRGIARLDELCVAFSSPSSMSAGQAFALGGLVVDGRAAATVAFIGLGLLLRYRWCGGAHAVTPYIRASWAKLARTSDSDTGGETLLPHIRT